MEPIGQVIVDTIAQVFGDEDGQSDEGTVGEVVSG